MAFLFLLHEGFQLDLFHADPFLVFLVFLPMQLQIMFQLVEALFEEGLKISPFGDILSDMFLHSLLKLLLLLFNTSFMTT